MGYSGLGETNPALKQRVRTLMTTGVFGAGASVHAYKNTDESAVVSMSGQLIAEEAERIALEAANTRESTGEGKPRFRAQRNYALAVQQAFGDVVLDAVAEVGPCGCRITSTKFPNCSSWLGRNCVVPQVLSALGREEQYSNLLPIGSVVMSGGAGMNVLLTHRLSVRFRLPVHVPPDPGDGGLAVGAAWLMRPPPRPSPSLRASVQSKVRPCSVYSGAWLWDAAYLAEYAAAGEARRIGPEELAVLLAGGAIVGVVRGRQEFGPRALGHRSLLALPTSLDIKDRMNAVKAREWWRPVAPMLMAEEVDVVFSSPPVPIVSPFMSFAPRLHPAMESRAPGIWHFDGTARPQTVAHDGDDPWLHTLLAAVKRRTGMCNV